MKRLFAEGSAVGINAMASRLVRFILLITMAMFSQFSGLASSSGEASGTQFVYLGTYTGQKSKGIYVAQFEPQTGKLTTPELAAESRNPTFLAVGPGRKTLYAVNEVNDFGDGKQGAVSAFKLDERTGRLTFLNQLPSGGAGPCHLAVAQNGKCVLVANYGSGSVAVLPLDASGGLREPSASIQHHGSSINPQRQEGPHAHFITWDPRNRVVLTCDLGLDKVLIYQLNDSRFGLSPNDPPDFSLKPGSGPRHLAFHPNARYAYVLSELSSTLTACSYDQQKGELKEIQTVSALPDDFHGGNTCAEVQVHPSGRFVFASNRGHNSIAVFAIEPATGKVKLVQHESTQGKNPRHFLLDPSARWLLAENQDSDTVVVFAVDAQSGRLSPSGITQKVGAPVCAVFVPQL
jgi:6-phosphogluconolactonase